MERFIDKIGNTIISKNEINTEELFEYNKLRHIFNTLVDIYGERIGEIRFRMYCIKNHIEFHGYGDYRSLEIILGSYNPEKLAVECFLHYDDPDKFKENPKEDIKLIIEGYKLLLSKK
jgi:hypothetical protein